MSRETILILAHLAEDPVLSFEEREAAREAADLLERINQSTLARRAVEVFA
jgi:hypothetical protein